MLLRFCSLLSLPILLIGCVTAPASKVPSLPAPDIVAEPQQAEQPESWPKVELTADLMLRFLAGDIAAQRGQSDLAAKAWLDIAKTSKDPRAAKRATELSLSTGQIGLALESVQVWSQASPESTPALHLKMSLLLRANRLAEAEALIPQLKKMPVNDLASFYMQMYLFWAAEADKTEIARLTGLITRDMSQMPEAHFAMAVMHAIQERNNEAVVALDAGLALRPWWEQAVLYKAQLLAQKTPEAAFVFLREAMNKNPGNTAFALTLARALTEDKKFDEARKIYAEILVQQPEQLDALVGLGLLAMQQRDLDTAFKNLSAALKQGPRNTNLLHYMLGQIEEERNKLNEALDWYRQAGGNEKPGAQMRMAHVLAKLGQAEAAIAVIADMPTATPAEKIEKFQLEGQVWRVLKNGKKGLEVLTRAIGQFPEATDLYYDRSLFLDMQGDIAGAEADLRHVLSKQPDNAMAINALGYILASRTDRLAEAETLLDKASLLDPDNPTIIDSVGWLRFKQNRLADATKLLALAYSMLEDPEIASHYVEVLWQSGEKDKARAVFDKALRRNPKDDLLLETSKRLGL